MARNRHAASEPGVREAEDYRAAIQSVLGLFYGLTAARVAHRRATDMKLLHGMVAHCNNIASAALKLLDDADDHSAAVAPLVRIALEHAMTAQWIVTQPDGQRQFMQQSSYKSAKFHKLTDKVGAEIPVEVREWYADRPAPQQSASLTQVRKMFEALDPSEWSYVEYAHLSSLTHPSAAEVVMYLDTRAEPPGLLLRPAHDRRALLFTLARAVVLANAVYFDLLRGKPNKAAISKIARDAHLPLWLSSDGKAPQ